MDPTGDEPVDHSILTFVLRWRARVGNAKDLGNDKIDDPPARPTNQVTSPGNNFPISASLVGEEIDINI